MGRQSIVPELEKKLNTPLKPWLTARVREGKTVDEIASALGIGKSKAYQLIDDFALKQAMKDARYQKKTSGGELKHYLDEYAKEKRIAGLSDETLRSDEESWRNYIWWLEHFNKPLDLNAVQNLDLILEFFDYLSTEKNRFGRQFKSGVQKGTLATYKKRMAAFIHWCQKMGYIKDDKASDPFSKMRTIKVPKVIEDIPDSIIHKLLTSFGDSKFEDVRDKAILCWFLETGMRRGGVGGVKMSDFDWERGVGRITEKGNKQRVIVLSEKLKSQLKHYLDLRQPVASTPYLWVTKTGERLEIARIYDIVASWNKVVASDIKEQCPGQRIHPHIFRHIWAKHLAESEVPGFAMMVMAGWSDLKLVQHYASAYNQDKAWNYIDQSSPLSKIY